jgi:hypothetical protein
MAEGSYIITRLDLASLDSVWQFVDSFRHAGMSLDSLVCNPPSTTLNPVNLALGADDSYNTRRRRRFGVGAQADAVVSRDDGFHLSLPLMQFAREYFTKITSYRRHLEARSTCPELSRKVYFCLIIRQSLFYLVERLWSHFSCLHWNVGCPSCNMCSLVPSYWSVYSLSANTFNFLSHPWYLIIPFWIGTLLVYSYFVKCFCVKTVAISVCVMWQAFAVLLWYM